MDKTNLETERQRGEKAKLLLEEPLSHDLIIAMSLNFLKD